MKLNIKEILGDKYKDNMTLAEIESALSDIDVQDESSKKEIEKLTNSLSKSNSEAAEYKRKLREKQSEEELAKEEREKELATLKEENASLKREKLIADNENQLIALGYDTKLAKETSIALVDGDITKVFENQKKFNEQLKKSIEAELLKKTPTPPGGTGDNTITKERYRAMSLAEKQKLADENPTLYKKLNDMEE